MNIAKQFHDLMVKLGIRKAEETPEQKKTSAEIMEETVNEFIERQNRERGALWIKFKEGIENKEVTSFTKEELKPLIDAGKETVYRLPGMDHAHGYHLELDYRFPVQRMAGAYCTAVKALTSCAIVETVGFGSITRDELNKVYETVADKTIDWPLDIRQTVIKLVKNNPQFGSFRYILHILPSSVVDGVQYYALAQEGLFIYSEVKENQLATGEALFFGDRQGATLHSFHCAYTKAVGRYGITKHFFEGTAEDPKKEIIPRQMFAIIDGVDMNYVEMEQLMNLKKGMQ